MGKLYILGGRQRKAIVRDPIKEWHWYEAALILELDTETGAARTCVEYLTPREARASDASSINFHSGALVGTTLYTCTTTEVLIFRLPGFERVGYVSLPCFNDVHHATPAADGNLLVVSTGLDMVVKVTPEGQVVSEWNVLDEEPWSRFSRTTDYRKVETTKPHMAHDDAPNAMAAVHGAVEVGRLDLYGFQAAGASHSGAGRSVPQVGAPDSAGLQVVAGRAVQPNDVAGVEHDAVCRQAVDLRALFASSAFQGSAVGGEKVDDVYQQSPRLSGGDLEAAFGPVRQPRFPSGTQRLEVRVSTTPVVRKDGAGRPRGNLGIPRALPPQIDQRFPSL